MRVFTTLDEVAAATGDELGTSEWLTIDQDRVDRFAEATGDHQWIHVDVERAAAGPFGGTIAHGYLTLSLLPFLGSTVFSLETPGAKLNYGVNKVRFPNPLRVGSRIRSTISVSDVAAAAGTEIGTSEWLAIDQARIDAFADATLDHQWIHVDVEQAAAGSGCPQSAASSMIVCGRRPPSRWSCSRTFGARST